MYNYFDAESLTGQISSTVSLVELQLSVAHFTGLSLLVVFMLIPMIHNQGRETHGQILSDIARIVEAGGLQPVLDEKRFSLPEIGDAHARLSSGQGMGKVVVEI